MREKLLAGVMVLCVTGWALGADVLVLEDGEDPNLRDTYLAGGDGYWAESATAPVASPTTGNWAKFLYATGDNYWAAFTKKNEYVPDDLSSYKNGTLEMQLLWRENYFPAGWDFFIQGDPGDGSTARVGFSLRNDGNTFGWGNDTWHKVSIDINNGLFDLAGGTVDGASAMFKDRSDALDADQVTSLWSNVTGWQIVAGTGWTGWQAFGVEDLVLIPGAAPVLAGDANNDGMVDVGDLGILAGNYGMTSGATWGQGDFNGDGAVDVGDLGILAGNYGESSVASVPEPVSLSLLGLGGLALIRRKW